MANPVMETVTFRLLPGTDSAAFLAAARATAPLVAACPGFVARHLTCDADGTWTDLVEWTGAGQAGEITFTMNGERQQPVTEVQVLQTS